MHIYAYIHISIYYDGNPELLKTKQFEYERLFLSEELEWPRGLVSLQ